MDLLLYALFAAAVAIGATVAVERWGGVTGGLLATLPTTIVPAAAGMHATSDPSAFGAAMAAVPPGMLLNALFLLLWRELPRRLPATSLAVRLGLMTAASLGAWLVGAVTLVLGTEAVAGWGVPALAVGLLGAALHATLGLSTTWRPAPAPAGHRRVSLPMLLARGLLAGAAIAVAIAIARSGAGLAAGVASVFPAIFLTTMAGLWLAQGEAVPAGAVGPMVVGSSGVTAYALLAPVWLPAAGPILGSLACWLTAVLVATVPAWAWLRWRRRA